MGCTVAELQQFARLGSPRRPPERQSPAGRLLVPVPARPSRCTIPSKMRPLALLLAALANFAEAAAAPRRNGLALTSPRPVAKSGESEVPRAARSEKRVHGVMGRERGAGPGRTGGQAEMARTGPRLSGVTANRRGANSAFQRTGPRLSGNSANRPSALRRDRRTRRLGSRADRRTGPRLPGGSADRRGASRRKAGRRRHGRMSPSTTPSGMMASKLKCWLAEPPGTRQ